MERKSTTSSAAKSARSTDSKPFFGWAGGASLPRHPLKIHMPSIAAAVCAAFRFSRCGDGIRFLLRIPCVGTSQYTLIHKITAVSPSSTGPLVRKDRSSHIVRRHALQKPSASARVREGAGAQSAPAPSRTHPHRNAKRSFLAEAPFPCILLILSNRRRRRGALHGETELAALAHLAGHPDFFAHLLEHLPGNG